MANPDAEGKSPLMAAVNAAIYDLHRSLDLGDSDFFCECGDVRCRERMTLTRTEYTRLREEGWPVIVAAHAQSEPSAPTAVGEKTVTHVQPARLWLQGLSVLSPTCSRLP